MAVVEWTLFFIWYLSLLGWGIAFVAIAFRDNRDEKRKQEQNRDWGYWITGLLFFAIGVSFIAFAVMEIAKKLLF